MVQREYLALQFGSAENVPAQTDICLLGYIFTGLTTRTLDPGVSPGKTSAPTEDCGAGMSDVTFTSMIECGFLLHL